MRARRAAALSVNARLRHRHGSRRDPIIRVFKIRGCPSATSMGAVIADRRATVHRRRLHSTSDGRGGHAVVAPMAASESILRDTAQQHRFRSSRPTNAAHRAALATKSSRRSLVL